MSQEEKAKLASLHESNIYAHMRTESDRNYRRLIKKAKKKLRKGGTE